MNITTFEEFKYKFDLNLKRTKLKENLIDNEIREILIFLEPVNKAQSYNAVAGGAFSPIQRISSRVFDLEIHRTDKSNFTYAFNAYYLRGEFEVQPYSEESESSCLNRQFITRQANEFVRYYLWLKELNIKDTNKESLNTKVLSLKERILILHYLGLNFTKYNQTATSEIISTLLDSDYSNTRKAIGQLLSATKEEKIKTQNNLLKVLEVFEHKDFNAIKTNVKNDLNKFWGN